MVTRGIFVLLTFGLVIGCAEPVFMKKARRSVTKVAQVKKEPPCVAVTPAFQQYFAMNIDWQSIRRVVLMPLANQTVYPVIMDDIAINLATELQRVGNYDLVVANHVDPGARAQDVFASGQFNELEVLRVAREYQADAVLFASVTQYHPYPPPRVGLSLLMISPSEGIPIATLNGMWDAREINVATQAQAYFKQNLSWKRSLLGSERVIDSPDVFQRFVCHQIATAFYPTSTATPQFGMPSMPTNPVMPSTGEMMTPGMSTPIYSNEPPPVPPAGTEMN